MNILEKFPAVSVLIVGDVMLDRYLWGSVERISPEAPVPIVKIDKITVAAGGAANVAANIAGLGARAYLVGLIGQDAEAELFPPVLKKLNISSDYLVASATRPTTLKTRVIAHNQQVLRFDQETSNILTASDEREINEQIDKIIGKTDVIVISDYAKGVLSETILSSLITSANSKGIPILIDPKGRDYKKYKSATVITPNRKEALEAVNLPLSPDGSGNSAEIIESAGNKLLADLILDALLITQGEDGMTLFRKGENPLHLEALARHVYDVTGAGDTVIATLAVALGAKADLISAAELANAAAGFVVEEVGTTVIDINRLEEYFASSDN